MSTHIRRAESPEDRDAVFRLVHDVYVEHGWVCARPGGRLVHYGHINDLETTTVLMALEEGELVGTCSLTLDGPGGLHVDEDFKRETDAVRREGIRLASSWRIATHPAHRQAKRVIRALLWANVEFWQRHSIDTCLMTFAPAHEKVYERLLNCRTVARAERTRSLNHSPLVLMRFDMNSCPAYWKTRRHDYDIRI